MKTLLMCSALVGLVACESAIPASRTAGDLITYDVEQARVAALSNPGTPPTGSASFAGLIGGPLLVDGETGSDFLGDINLNVNFNVNNVSGTIDEITLFDDGQPDQNLGGALSVSGSYAGALSATASGSLTAVEESGAFGISGSTNVIMNLTGTLRDDNGTNTLVGGATGSGTGDYEVFLQNGVGFYAVQQ